MEWESDDLQVIAILGEAEGVPEGYAWPFVVGDGAGHDHRRRLVLGTFDGGYRPVLDHTGVAIGVEPDPLFDNDALGDDRRIFRVASHDGERVLAGIGDGGALRFGWIDDNGAFDWQPHPVPGIEFGQNDFIRPDAEGAWVGRNPGLVRLAWPEREASEPAAPLSVTRAGYPEQGNWLRAGPGGASNLSDAVPNHRLPFQTGSLRFEYALAEFAEPDQHRYRVRLEGLDDTWSSWTEETRRDYTNLPGGDYLFRVQALDARGRVSEAAPLAFSVAPPWYLGTPMLAVYSAAALLLLWLAAVAGRARKARQWAARRQELEAQVADRTREVRRQAREIREMSDARAAFFANVSHELRTPLTLTRAPLEELARDTIQLTPDQRQHLDMALRNTEAMQSLIGQVLDLHRLDAERMPFHPARADLCAAVTSAVQRFDVHARSKGIDLVVEGAETPMLTAFDAGHLATTVSNLVSNALKFAPKGSTVTVRLVEQDDGHVIEVADAGPGVPDKDRERIFQRYQQADNAPQGGTGIGLALVRELVDLHEGRVEVGDAPGGGARFRVWLPARPDLPNAGARPDAEPADAPEPEVEIGEDASIANGNDDRNGNGDRPTVLIVDDNAELRGFLRLRLGRAYRIVEAGDGREGLEKARETIPDAIVTDGMMPELDGLGLTRELKADPEIDFIPVLMLTARGGADAVVRGMQAGADDYLAKPFDTAELAARIAGLIASRRRLRDRLAGQTVEPEPAEDPFITRARGILSEHLGEPGFSVRDWAALLHMDRTTLFRKLKAAVDRSPDEELREMRLQRAAELLRARAGNVAEVADAVGFASVSAFSRRFRERFGVSPAKFANKGDGT
nr:hybrid sensor histidine kinase/response regulator transcription factor [Wenzhouxiangella sp. XN79A]